MKRIIFFTLFWPLFSLGQPSTLSTQSAVNGEGIQFITDATWNEVLAKAKRENKYIFVDCYATWCGPCKKMDKEVYTNDTVGGFMNGKFVSVKIQMDTSKQDKAETKKWYADAHRIMEQYRISSFPTYLFFSPDGEILHKDIGAKSVNEFISVINESASPEKQFYNLQRLATKRKLSPALMSSLINMADYLEEKDLALQTGRDYMQLYLDTLNDNDFYTKDNLLFLSRYAKMVTSKDKIFDRYRHHGNKIDSIIGFPGYAKKKIYAVVNSELITPAINTCKETKQEPDWIKMTDAINQQYRLDYKEDDLLPTKVSWYRYRKNWNRYSYYLVQQVDNSLKTIKPAGMSGSLYLNNSAWDIFIYSNNKEELAKAIRWVDMALAIDTRDFQAMDTKANLLYKKGQVQEAIALEKNALAIIIKDKRPEQYKKECLVAMMKMKKGIPTWPASN